jgi:hypothetical protein
MVTLQHKLGQNKNFSVLDVLSECKGEKLEHAKLNTVTRLHRLQTTARRSTGQFNSPRRAGSGRSVKWNGASRSKQSSFIARELGFR